MAAELDDPETCEFAHLRGIYTRGEAADTTPADREHALNVVGEWLDYNSHRFTMPATEWGDELKGTLAHVTGMATLYAESKSPEAVQKRGDAIYSAVLDECLGYNGGQPHATTRPRSGYRAPNVPTLCDRCARLITTLQRLPSA